MSVLRPPLVAKRSYRHGVAVSIQLKCNGYGDSARIEGGVELTIDQARVLALSLIELADKADAKAAAKLATQERREKWRDREVAAGRMIVFGGVR